MGYRWALVALVLVVAALCGVGTASAFPQQVTETPEPPTQTPWIITATPDDTATPTETATPTDTPTPEPTQTPAVITATPEAATETPTPTETYVPGVTGQELANYLDRFDGISPIVAWGFGLFVAVCLGLVSISIFRG